MMILQWNACQYASSSNLDCGGIISKINSCNMYLNISVIQSFRRRKNMGAFDRSLKTQNQTNLQIPLAIPSIMHHLNPKSYNPSNSLHLHHDASHPLLPSSPRLSLITAVTLG